MQLIKDLSPPCFSIGERELETREMPSVGLTVVFSVAVGPRSLDGSAFSPIFNPTENYQFQFISSARSLARSPIDSVHPT